MDLDKAVDLDYLISIGYFNKVDDYSSDESVSAGLLLMDQVEMYNYLDTNYEKVCGYDFYRDLFPNNQLQGDYSGYYQPNAIYLSRDFDTGHYRRRLMLNGSFKEDYMEYVEKEPDVICSGLSYVGKRNDLKSARRMHSLIIDLDSVGYAELLTLFKRFGESPEIMRSLPMPTYLVQSGTGLHVYYFLEDPIPLYPNIRKQVQKLKKALTIRMWDYKATTREKNIQIQSISQGFRMVGSINEKYSKEIIAFKTGGRVSLSTLNSYVADEIRVDIDKKYEKGKHTLEEAKKLFPDWYEDVVVRGKERNGGWTFRDAVYKSWLNRADEVTGGHRYHYLMTLAACAYKCGIPREQLEEDVDDIFNQLRKVSHTHPLEEKDKITALKGYDEEFLRLPINTIRDLTGLHIEKTKRNGRSQAEHIRYMNLMRDNFTHPDGDWRKGNGRPKGSGTKEDLVKEYVKNNPEDNPTEIARALEISRPTVYKYLKVIKEEKII